MRRAQGPHAPTRSLRAVLMSSMLLFSLLPAATVGWLFYRSHLQSVHTLSEKIVANAAQRVRSDTENHLLQAHQALNGLIPEAPSASAAARARLLIQKPELFEQSAFVMTGMSPDLAKMYFGTWQGQFLGVETRLQGDTSLWQVSERKRGDQEVRFFAASHPADRRLPLPLAPGDYEPRSQPWYQSAMARKGRIFTPVSVSAGQLLLTLAQPVYASDGAALGVLAVDLPLKRLGQMLQGMRISPNGAVFLFDEQGLLVASSTGDALFSEAGGRLQRHSPAQSNNAILRSAYAEAAPALDKTREPGAQRESFLRRIPMAQDTLMVALTPFGESRGVRWSLVVAAPESDFTQEAEQALQKILAIAGLTLLPGALLAIGLAYRLSRRFKLPSAAAAQLARAEVSPVQHAAPVTEVHQPSQTLHDSAQELQRSHAVIEAQAQPQDQALQQANESLEARHGVEAAAPDSPRLPEPAASDLQPAQVLVDWSRLEQFREFDDDALSMTREVIALFAGESPQRMDDIRLALSACDSAALSRAAHALKGAASNIGAQALSEACGLLEQSCLQGQWPADAALQVARTLDCADKTRQALSDWAQAGPAAAFDPVI